MSSTTPTHRLVLLSPFNPPSLARTWFSAPHPTLPFLATCSSDKTVRIYSLTSFTLLSTISGGHSRSIRTCAWKPNTKGQSVLATGSFDASVGIWKHWERNSSYDEDEDFDLSSASKRIATTMKSADSFAGSSIESSSEEDENEEWKFSVVLDGHDSEVKSVAFSASGQLLATCSRDKSVWVWEEVSETSAVGGVNDDDDNYETIAVLQDHVGDVKCVVWHPTEELLASASYDDTIRLWREVDGDYECVSTLKGHTSTVWMIDFESATNKPPSSNPEFRDAWSSRLETSGPRLVSCSDDLTIRIWRRLPSKPSSSSGAAAEPFGGTNFPSIIRTGDASEDWVEEAQLPKAHVRSVYAVNWSKVSGRIVSCGGDGRIVVYEEMLEGDTTIWTVIARIEAAHGVFEVNHVCWARRRDRDECDEEIIVSTGDDGVVKAWTLEVV